METAELKILQEGIEEDAQNTYLSIKKALESLNPLPNEVRITSLGCEYSSLEHSG
jgi:hypothetical protein